MNGRPTFCDHCGASEPPAVSALRIAVSTRCGLANIAEELDACRWISAHDESLAAVLAKRPEVRQALYHAMAEAWADPAHDAPTALDVTEFAALWGRPHNLPTDFPRLLKRGLREMTLEERSNIYASVLDRLRPTFGGGAGAGLRRVGWIYLLADAADAAYRTYDAKTSIPLWDEAWQLIDELPPDRETSMSAVAHIAIGYATAVGNLPDRDSETAMERLVTAGDWIERNVASTAIATQVVNLGIAQAKIWYLRRVNGLTGWITSESRRLELLDRAEQAMWKYLPQSERAFSTRDLADLPEKLKVAVARLHLDMAAAAAIVDRHRSTVAAEIALRLSTRPHHHFTALLGVARSEQNLTRRVAYHEQLLRETYELHGRASPWQQNTISVQLADACHDLGGKLYRVGRPTAAWFWRREGASWSNRPRGDDRSRPRRSVGPLDTEIAAPAIGDEAADGGALDGGKATEITKLESNIKAENTVGLVLAVMAMVARPTGIEVLRSAAAIIDDWHPELRRPRPERFEPAKRRTAEDFRRSLLESADEIAAGYATHLRPELLNKLARQAALAPTERLAVAKETLAVSLEAARWTEATKALRVILAVAVEVNDSAVIADSVHALCGIVQHAVTQSRGTADLIDVARQMTAVSTRIATVLAAYGHAELAFHTAHAGLGAITRIFAEDARLIEEFELAEQFHQKVEGADDRLFEAMHKRLKAPTPTSTATEPTAYQPEKLLTYLPGPAAYVQLFGNDHGGFWAVGCVVDSDSRRWWATRLDITAASLIRLRQAVWHSLRPKRTGRPRRTQALGRLHIEIVGRFRDELDGARHVVFVPHQPFASIPLHAARSDEGFLIEQHQVTYLSGLVDPTRPIIMSGSALVGGWDPAIGAPEEARELKKRLVAMGFDVVLPKTAVLGRHHYLNPQAQWDVVHIAAHGDYQLWPRSMASELRLSRTVRLSAGDWLRRGCRTSFVFINACDIGRNVPHAGDVNGFPLALRTRGNIAEVSALCPVDSATAGPFAQAFYQRWAGANSLEAYHAVCLDAIARVEPPAAWAPYVHTGVPITLALGARTVPNARAGGGRGRDPNRRRRARKSR